VSAVLGSACAGPAAPLAPPRPDAAVAGAPREVWVVRHGWHTRVAVRVGDVDARVWPESRAWGSGGYVEVGWGDRDFYPAPEPTVWDAIDAVVRATPAALHVGVMRAPPDGLVAPPHVVRLSVPAEGLERLARFVHAHYERDADGRPVRIGPGQYPQSTFYLARGRYHALTYNSNTWTASALREAGVPLGGGCVLTATSLMRRASEAARRLPGGPSGSPGGSGRQGPGDQLVHREAGARVVRGHQRDIVAGEDDDGDTAASGRSAQPVARRRTGGTSRSRSSPRTSST
jgi:uncharacterized protein (TIGR02117 family)